MLRFHLGLFSGAIKSMDRQPAEGEIVEIYSSANEYLGTGHFQKWNYSHSCFSFKKVDPRYIFWQDKLQTAYDVRKSIGIAENPNTNTYRLVHGEGDALPGLIIDIYDHTAVLQAHSIGMHLIHEQLAQALKM